MNAVNRFYACPRCDEPCSKLAFKDAYTKCDSCGMFHDLLDREEELYLTNLINKKDALIWRFHFNDCLYCYDAASHNLFDAEGTILPWLPYNISAERLKSLLILI